MMHLLGSLIGFTAQLQGQNLTRQCAVRPVQEKAEEWAHFMPILTAKTHHSLTVGRRVTQSGKALGFSRKIQGINI